jgi:hypothetical protein
LGWRTNWSPDERALAAVRDRQALAAEFVGLVGLALGDALGLQGLIAFDLAPDIADRPAQAGAQVDDLVEAGAEQIVRALLVALLRPYPCPLFRRLQRIAQRRKKESQIARSWP